MSNPLLANERIAESLPGPIPETNKATERGPVFATFSTIAEVTLVAANGLAFLGPEKPI